MPMAQIPMDLGTVMSRVGKNQYGSAEAVLADVRLVWSNCRGYNEQGTEVFKAAEEMEGFAEQLWRQARLPQVRPCPGRV